jgi:hypothetical protein
MQSCIGCGKGKSKKNRRGLAVDSLHTSGSFAETKLQDKHMPSPLITGGSGVVMEVSRQMNVTTATPVLLVLWL